MLVQIHLRRCCSPDATMIAEAGKKMINNKSSNFLQSTTNSGFFHSSLLFFPFGRTATHPRLWEPASVSADL